MSLTRPLYLAVVLALSLGSSFACKSEASAPVAETSAPVASEVAGAEIESKGTYSQEVDPRSPDEIIAELNAGGRVGPLEAYPAGKLDELRSKVTKIDLVFFTEGVSMSLDNPQAVAYALAAVSPKQSTRRPKCQPIGRMFMSAGKESVAEADIFFSDGCTYFEVFENKKPGYANEMTPEGKSFFNDNLRQAIPGFKSVK